jgi:hypothetical protein
VIQKTTAYLWDQRRLLLVWAAAAVDTADDLLKFCGWDPQAPAFRQVAFIELNAPINHGKFGEDREEMEKKRAADPAGFYSKHVLKVQDTVSVEDWAQDLRQCATRLSFLRGRVYQSLDSFPRAQHEFRGCLALSKGFPGALLELAKTLLAQGDYVNAHTSLLGLIRKEIPSMRSVPDIDPVEVLKLNKQLGMLLILAESSMKQLKLNFNVGSANQKKMFTVHDNGILDRPKELKEIEIIHGRTLGYLALKRQEELTAKARSEVADANATIDLLRLRAMNIARRSQDLIEECKDAITDTRAFVIAIPKTADRERERERDKKTPANKPRSITLK